MDTQKQYKKTAHELSTETIARQTWLPSMVTGLSMLTCYGTLAALSLLSLAGISITLNNTIWASAIVVFSILAVVVIAIGNLKRKYYGPIILAAIGASLVTYAMFVSYSVSIEVIGFGMLVIATFWDFLSKRKIQHQTVSR